MLMSRNHTGRHSQEVNFGLTYNGYPALPKEIGSVPAEELSKLADLNVQNAENVSGAASIQFRKIAASAYTEAALFTDDKSHAADYLVLAGQHLRTVADDEYKLLERGFRHPNDQDLWQRAELQFDFMDMYIDLAFDSITTETKDEIITKLSDRLEYLKLQMNVGYTAGIRGLTYEIMGLLSVWDEYNEEGDLIAFPSTIRGGDGSIDPCSTHDIVLGARQDKTWNFMNIEVKGGRSPDLTNPQKRYDCPIMHISRDGTIRIIEPRTAA